MGVCAFVREREKEPLDGNHETGLISFLKFEVVRYLSDHPVQHPVSANQRAALSTMSPHTYHVCLTLKIRQCHVSLVTCPDTSILMWVFF